MLLFTADVYPSMHPWKGKVAAWCCPLARLTCCIISQHVLKIDGVASLIAGLLGVFNQCFWNVIFHNPNQRYVIGIHQYSYRTWEKPVPCNVTCHSQRIVCHFQESGIIETGFFYDVKLDRSQPGSGNCRPRRTAWFPPSFFGRGPMVYLVLSPGEQKIQDVTKSNHIHMVDFRTKKTAQLSSVHHKSFQKLKGNPIIPNKPARNQWTKIQQEKPSQLSWGPLRSRSVWLGAAAWGLEASHRITRGNNMKPYPSWELTYPIQFGSWEDEFPNFPQVAKCDRFLENVYRKNSTLRKNSEISEVNNVK